MSIELSGGIFSSVAGSQMAQTTGADVGRLRQDTIDRQRRVVSRDAADRAAGIAEPDGNDLAADDRDADGRRAWEIEPPRTGTDRRGPWPAAFESKDARGSCGTALDLVG